MLQIKIITNTFNRLKLCLGSNSYKYTEFIQRKYHLCDIDLQPNEVNSEKIK